MSEDAILDNVSVHQLWGRHGKRIEISLKYGDAEINIELEKRVARELADLIYSRIEDANEDMKEEEE